MNIVSRYSLSQNQSSFSRFLVALMISISALLPFSVSVHAKPDSVKHQQTAVVNINKASAEQIAEVLNGVGAKKAEAIVAYRKANGSFKTLSDLTNVKGIGEATVNKNKSRIKM